MESLQSIPDITTAEQLETATNHLIADLQRAADIAAPQLKPTKEQAARRWNVEVRDAVQTALKAQRSYTSAPSPLTYKELQKARQTQTKAIEVAKRPSDGVRRRRIRGPKAAMGPRKVGTAAQPQAIGPSQNARALQDSRNNANRANT